MRGKVWIIHARHTGCWSRLSRLPNKMVDFASSRYLPVKYHIIRNYRSIGLHLNKGNRVKSVNILDQKLVNSSSLKTTDAEISFLGQGQKQ